MTRAEGEFVAVPLATRNRIAGLVRRGYLHDCEAVEVIGIVPKEREDSLHLITLPPANKSAADEVAAEVVSVLSEESDSDYRSFRIQALSPDGTQLAYITIKARTHAADDKPLSLHPTSGYKAEDVWIRDLIRRDRERDAMLRGLMGSLGQAMVSERAAHRAEIEAMESRIEWYAKTLHEQNQLYVETRRADALLKAEAAVVEAQGRAIDETIALVKDVGPSIAKGVAAWAGAKGAREIHAAIPAKVREMFHGLEPKQVEAIADMLTPKQRAEFVAAWSAVQEVESAKKEGAK